MVQTAKEQSMGVRSVVDKKGANKALQILEQDETEMSDKCNKKYRDNIEKLKTRENNKNNKVVRNISFKHREKGMLSMGEKKMLGNANLITSLFLLIYFILIFS